VRRSRRANRFVALVMTPILLLLSFLAADALVLVFDALALVRLGLPEGADLGGHLADPLQIRPAYGDLSRLLAFDRHPRRNGIDDVMAEAELELQVLALDLGAVADAVDLEGLREALGNAGHHVVDKAARCSPERSRPLRLGTRSHHDLAVLQLGLDFLAQAKLELSELAFGLQYPVGDLDGHSGGYWYGVFAYAGHGTSRPQNTRQSTSPPRFAARASLSDMTPFGVDNMEMPRPLYTLGRSLIFE